MKKMSWKERCDKAQDKFFDMIKARIEGNI